MMNTLESIIKTCLISLLLPLVVLTTAYADNEQLAKELTGFYRSARAVISKNQNHINNPDIGDKGLNGQSVVDEAFKNYLKSKGSAFDTKTDKQAKDAMIRAIKVVMDSAQNLINEKGTGFKGFLPAVFARQTATEFSQIMDGKMTIKLTAPKNYTRNRANRPDKWEHNIIENYFRSADYAKGKAISSTRETVKGKPAFRYMLPEYYKESCLSCHGTPKGEKDITGGKKEGGQLGELGGAISLIIFD